MLGLSVARPLYPFADGKSRCSSLIMHLNSNPTPNDLCRMLVRSTIMLAIDEYWSFCSYYRKNRMFPVCS